MHYSFEHPYPVREIKSWHKPMRIVDFVIWIGIFVYMWHADRFLVPIIAGMCITFILERIASTLFRCPSCKKRLTERVVMDDGGVDHYFLDCHHCKITYNPQYTYKFDDAPSNDDY